MREIKLFKTKSDSACRVLVRALFAVTCQVGYCKFFSRIIEYNLCEKQGEWSEFLNVCHNDNKVKKGRKKVFVVE